jgi:hypothetical protein
MNQFNLNNFIFKFVNYSFSNLKGENFSNTSATKLVLNQPNFIQNNIPNTLTPSLFKTFNPSMLASLKMNDLESFNRSVYIKDLMKLPKDLEEILILIQNNISSPKDSLKLLTTNINLFTLSELIKQNGKEAMSKLILVMANASKQGINDLSQIKDAIKFINASVSAASQENLSQMLKNFMLLYLPWLPLQEGVDFDLGIETSEDEKSDSQTSVTIMISTKNYGNIKIVLVLFCGNSIDIFVSCSDIFPKAKLLEKIKIECKNHSIQSNISFEEKKIQQSKNVVRQAKVSMSDLSEINPFLLLMANIVIKHTIDLDNSAENT